MNTVSDQEFEEWARPRGYNLRCWFNGYAAVDTQNAKLGWSARDAKIIELEAKIRELTA